MGWGHGRPSGISISARRTSKTRKLPATSTLVRCQGLTRGGGRGGGIGAGDATLRDAHGEGPRRPTLAEAGAARAREGARGRERDHGERPRRALAARDAPRLPGLARALDASLRAQDVGGGPEVLGAPPGA